MSKTTKWTPEQSDAITEKNSNLLVAAAAGSGKTAVVITSYSIHYTKLYE